MSSSGPVISSEPSGRRVIFSRLHDGDYEADGGPPAVTSAIPGEADSSVPVATRRPWSHQKTTFRYDLTMPFNWVRNGVAPPRT